MVQNPKLSKGNNNFKFLPARYVPKASMLNAWKLVAATANPVVTSVTPIITRLTELKNKQQFNNISFFVLNPDMQYRRKSPWAQCPDKKPLLQRYIQLSCL